MIEIYTKSECKKCKDLLDYLNNIQIKYVEINLDKKDNKKAYDYWKSLNVDILPIIILKRTGQNVILVNCTERNVNIFLKTYGIIKEE